MPVPVAAIFAAIELGQRAFGVISSFSGNAQAAKANAAVQDAVKVVSAVAPLVQQFAAGNEITDADVRESFARVGASFDELDAEIARKKGGQP